MTELSPPAERKLTQTRTICCTAYARRDGLWDIEAHLCDTKPEAMTHPRSGTPRPPGQPVHEMKIRVTIDNDMLIHDAEAVTIYAPFDACVVPPGVFPKLKGLSFKKGWKNDVAGIMGGTKGCTHLRELLGNLATVGYQTVVSSEEYQAKIDLGEIKPFYIGSCHAYEESGAVVQRLYPDLYKPSATERKGES